MDGTALRAVILLMLAVLKVSAKLDIFFFLNITRAPIERGMHWHYIGCLLMLSVEVRIWIVGFMGT